MRSGMNQKARTAASVIALAAALAALIWWAWPRVPDEGRLGLPARQGQWASSPQPRKNGIANPPAHPAAGGQPSPPPAASRGLILSAQSADGRTPPADRIRTVMSLAALGEGAVNDIAEA